MLPVGGRSAVVGAVVAALGARSLAACGIFDSTDFAAADASAVGDAAEATPGDEAGDPDSSGPFCATHDGAAHLLCADFDEGSLAVGWNGGDLPMGEAGLLPEFPAGDFARRAPEQERPEDLADRRRQVHPGRRAGLPELAGRSGHGGPDRR